MYVPGGDGTVSWNAVLVLPELVVFGTFSGMDGSTKTCLLSLRIWGSTVGYALGMHVSGGRGGM
jgi:hypothetical protein